MNSVCVGAGHEDRLAAGVVVLAECNEGSCTGHPYCAECIEILLTDPYNTLCNPRTRGSECDDCGLRTAWSGGRE